MVHGLKFVTYIHTHTYTHTHTHTQTDTQTKRLIERGALAKNLKFTLSSTFSELAPADMVLLEYLLGYGVKTLEHVT